MLTIWILALSLQGWTVGPVLGAEVTATAPPEPLSAPSGSKLAPPTNPDAKLRNFYQVLEDVVGDFEYDVKNDQVQGLKDLSIRNLALSENIPTSFKSHLELLITERVLKNPKARVLQCLPCRSKRAQLADGNVVVSGPDTNPVELARLAKMAGIKNFMDIAFSYQPTGLILSFYITDTEAGSVVWSRSYNSETSKSAAFRRGVDFNQTDEARSATEYVARIQWRPVVYYLFEPTTAGSVGTLVPGIRIVERYDNRKKEVGFEINYNLDTSFLVGTTAATGNIWGGFNLTLLFIHSWNLIGDEEIFSKVRGNLFLGIGGTYASGYLGGLVRAGYEWRMGKHWAVSANLGYRPSAAYFLSGASNGNITGLEFGVGISAIF